MHPHQHAPLATFMDKNEFLVGHDTMDQRHTEFYELLCALQAAQGSDAQAAALGELITHTRDHFDEENQLMVRTDYAIRDCHIQEHHEVLASLVEVHERVCRGDTRALPRLIAALEHWFPGHVQHLDSALAQWATQKRWAAQPILLRRNATREVSTAPCSESATAAANGSS